jgi:DNA primase
MKHDNKPAKQDDAVLALDGDKAERKGVARAAGVALQQSIAQRAIFVQLALPHAGFDLRKAQGMCEYNDSDHLII